MVFDVLALYWYFIFEESIKRMMILMVENGIKWLKMVLNIISRMVSDI
jgi:hypothetical protein